ncbi:hypothetical protein M3172_21370 [Mesobacillus subterraneus]|uniref:hypothetical protein n=1 Tax=Mesobacillus subterraneus TaxID=285983 RepID=UPI00203AEA70|nr:hypothetical protein [Mesobacillus subterraneus]MCM3575746.1 hypothetical protein [Mesobacillus subterraneus]
MKKKNFYILSIAILILLIYGVAKWDNYREKNLVSLLDTSKIEKIYYNQLPIMDEKAAHNRQITETASILELIHFLSQYNLKKVGDRDFVSEYPDEQFQFQLEYKDERITMPSLIEKDILLHDLYQYHITNGPVGYEWLEWFLEKHGEEV